MFLDRHIRILKIYRFSVKSVNSDWPKSVDGHRLSATVRDSSKNLSKSRVVCSSLKENAAKRVLGHMTQALLSSVLMGSA